MGEVTTVPVIPNELVPFQPARHGPGHAAAGLAALTGATASAETLSTVPWSSP